nr:hypothetical protein [Kibdelosporangium sp. MJ126-NF4]CTQ89150.1 hypothetical protein [Kibdelosporangium sp. MJ126-NF4]
MAGHSSGPPKAISGGWCRTSLCERTGRPSSRMAGRQAAQDNVPGVFRASRDSNVNTRLCLMSRGKSHAAVDS